MTTKAQNTTPGGKHGSTVTRVFDYAFCLRLPPKHINQSNSDPREKVKDAGLLTFTEKVNLINGSVGSV